MSIKVRATTRGYYGGRVYEAGEEFEIADRKQVGSWMDVAVEEKGPAKAPSKGGKKAEQPDNAQDLA